MQRLETLRPRSQRFKLRAGRHAVNCLVGMPPEGVAINPVAVQLVPGLASGHAIFAEYGRKLNQQGYATVVTEHEKPGVDNHADIREVTRRLLSGDFGVDPKMISYATHSFGTYDMVVGLSSDDAADIRAVTHNGILVAPVGFGGVQSIGGGAQTVTREFLHRPHERRVRKVAMDSVWYSMRAGVRLGPLIREARRCNLIERTQSLIEQGIGIGAILYTHDHLIHYHEVSAGLAIAGVQDIASIEADHNGILFQAEQTLRAGLEIRDSIEKKRNRGSD